MRAEYHGWSNGRRENLVRPGGRPMSPRTLHLALLPPLLLASTLASCAAVYPELGTRTRRVPEGQPLDPPPPAEIRWLKVLSGRVPEKTRGGRPWKTTGKGADPYAK